MFFEEAVALTNFWRSDPATIARSHELLALTGYTEHIENSGGCGHGAFAQFFLYPVAQFMLLEEFLEGLEPSDIPVLERIPGLEIQIRLQTGGNNQQAAGILPGAPQYGSALRDVLDNVD